MSCGYFENFDYYYLGWAILILVLLWILVCAGYVYNGDKGEFGHGGTYNHEMSMSPGHGHHHGYHHGHKW